MLPLMIVGINGFGRIGKIVYRVMRQRGHKIPLINDPAIDACTAAYALTYDSVTPQKERAVKTGENEFKYLGETTKVTTHCEPKLIPWRDHGVEVVIEASGFFLEHEKCMAHIKAGAKKVVITAPSPDAKMFVMGVNENDYNGEEVVSNASCTTNCLAPIAKAIHDEFVIVEGLMSTIHAATATQKVVDTVSKKNRRLSRSFSNIIPSSTGAAKAVGKVIPDLNGKLTGMAFRVPVMNVSVVDLTVRTQKECTLEQINECIRKAAEGRMKGIVAYTDEEIVSSDINGSEYSSVYDSKAGIQLNKTFFKVVSWYDNEHGYSCRVVDLAEYVWNSKK
ncbi:Glyceraldehyde 3-phosphate dehydrogenase [Trachipleistophora hominis]|uniref:Glyceraldehyde-3-phosphate dehydrogenase n=1 Tax=Trachipleistophora hominis TaxID=72359 RepID=L7JUJ8_TRAHO|nr:Glyceraldehyde 3-phosphate dehydrogenase [Trachipleistophora hominis]